MKRATTDPTAILKEMAGFLANHKLVPFVGAGISRQQLGFAAAELAGEMAGSLGLPADTMLSDVSDAFAEEKGNAAFVDFLRSKLVRTDFDDRLTPTHRLLVSTMAGVIYTTNQDNLFELVAAHYGRRYRRIVTLEDIAEATPGERLLYKFHGDPDVPTSLVFGAHSYQERIAAADHPLDIRLKSDLLGKRLLFLGYSLRDENVSKLFKQVQRTFNGKLPKSYLLAFDSDPELVAAAEQFGIEVVVPAQVFPDEQSPVVAFELCLKFLCDETIAAQVGMGMRWLLSDAPVNPRLVTEFEVDALEPIVSTAPFADSVEAFRSHIDSARIPEFLLDRVTAMFVGLIDRADPNDLEQMRELKGALFNFSPPSAFAIQATAAFMARCNGRTHVEGYDEFSSLGMPAVPDDGIAAAATMAIAILGAREEPVTDAFRKPAMFWFQRYDTLPDEVRGTAEQMISAAWPGSLASSSPINDPLRTFGVMKTFHEIQSGLMASFPQQRDTPVE